MVDKKKHLVVKDNKLIRAFYSLTLQQTRFLLFCITKLKRNEGKGAGNAVEIKVGEFCEMFPAVYSKNAYNDLINLSDKLLESYATVQCEDEPNKYEDIPWLQRRIRHGKGSGKIVLEFNFLMMPYLSGLANYTSYDLRGLGDFKYAHTARLFELLVQFKANSEVKIGVDELSKILSGKKEGCEYKYLNRKLITPAIEDLNKNSIYNVDFTVEKEGRKVSAVIFHYTKKDEI